MKVITCVSDAGHPGPADLLRTSCRKHELDLVILHHRGQWISHRLKDYLLLLYVRRLPIGDIVMFSDGYNTMLIASEEEILTKYAAFDAPLVFAARHQCTPCSLLSPAFPPSPTELRFLGAGGFIGRAGTIADILSTYAEQGPSLAALAPNVAPSIEERIRRGRVACDAQFSWSNQYFWSLLFLCHPELIVLDYQSTIFLSLIRGNREQINAGHDISAPQISCGIKDKTDTVASERAFRDATRSTCHVLLRNQPEVSSVDREPRA